MNRQLAQPDSHPFRTVRWVLVLSVILFGCGSDGATEAGQDVEPRSPFEFPGRGTDPATGLPLPPSDAERAVGDFVDGFSVPSQSGGNDVTSGQQPSGEPTPPESSTGVGISVPSSDDQTAGDPTRPTNPPINDSNIAVGSIPPPLFATPPTPPPTRPSATPTTAGTPITAPVSAPTTTTLANQVALPFLCDVDAVVVDGTVKRLIVSIPSSNRTAAWIHSVWPDSTTSTVSIDLSSGSGTSTQVVSSLTRPAVYVFESPNRLASELGCSFTP